MQQLVARTDFAKIRDVQGPYNGYTPLMDAAWHGHAETVRVLLEAGARTDLVGLDGETALSLAQRFGYSEIEQLIRAHL